MIFVSYSHLDSHWRDALRTMAAPLQRFGGVKFISDKDILAGTSWETTLKGWLDEATVVLLLVSEYW